MHDTKQRPARSEKVAHRVVDGAAYLVDAETTKLYALNPVATDVWDLCDGQHSVADIARCIEDRYDVGADRATADVKKFITDFVDLGLLSLPD